MKYWGNNRYMNFCYGYPLKVKGLHYSKNYEGCVSQHGINIFLALEMDLTCDIMKSDSTNYYAQDPTPYQLLYVNERMLYDQYSQVYSTI